MASAHVWRVQPLAAVLILIGMGTYMFVQHTCGKVCNRPILSGRKAQGS